jgi:hypothetical protein
MPREEVATDGGNPLKRIAIALVVAFVLTYAIDYGLLRQKMASANPAAAYGSVTSFYGTATKGGKMEIFTDQPQTETCVHSLFPHSGYRACWYIPHGSVKQI